MKTEIELFENALDTTSVNGKKLREYINENYISNSVLDKIRAEIKEESKFCPLTEGQNEREFICERGQNEQVQNTINKE